MTTKPREFWLGIEAQRYAHREFPTAEGDAIHVIEYSEYERILKLNKTAAKQIIHEIDLGQTAINYKESLVAAQDKHKKQDGMLKELACETHELSFEIIDLKAEIEKLRGSLFKIANAFHDSADDKILFKLVMEITQDARAALTGSVRK